MPLCHIKTAVLGAMQEEARRAYPHEACGLMVGRRDVDAITIEELVISENVADGDKRVSFMIDPQLQFTTLRALRGTGREVVGVFHSHPDGEPFPSATDAAMAFEAGFVWLIVAVAGGEKTRARAHLSQGEGQTFAPVQLAIEP